MDPANIPLPDSPESLESSDASAVPSATVATLVTSSTVPSGVEDSLTTFLTQLRCLATSVTDIFVPKPVRQDWVYIFTTISNKITTYPTKYRYSVLALAALLALAEWQQPGFISRPRNFFNAIVGSMCAMLLATSWLALLDYIETATWPWEQDGWVWPWQAWLWQDSVYGIDLGASTSTRPDGPASPVSPATPLGLTFSSLPTSSISANNPGTTFNFPMPPPPTPTVKQHTMLIPPTPQLPGGLRPIYLPPPTPAQIHHSGILGESPMPPTRFRHFSGTGFARKTEELRAVAKWASPGSSKSLQAFRNSELSVLLGKRAVEVGEEGRVVKKGRTPRAGGDGMGLDKEDVSEGVGDEH
jgi:hypothetical protein